MLFLLLTRGLPSVQNPLDALLPPGSLRQFDVVSMQFCMHYAFESEEKVRMMLHNVTAYLRPGGMFIGTIPNSRSLLYVPSSSRISPCLLILTQHLIFFQISSFIWVLILILGED